MLNMKTSQNGLIISTLILLAVLLTGYVVYTKTNTEEATEEVVFTDVKPAPIENPTATSTSQKVGVKKYSDANVSFEYPADYVLQPKGADELIIVSKGNYRFIVSKVGLDSATWETYKTENIGEFAVKFKKNSDSSSVGILIVAEKKGTPYFLRATAPSESDGNSSEFNATLQTILLTLK